MKRTTYLALALTFALACYIAPANDDLSQNELNTKLVNAAESGLNKTVEQLIDMGAEPGYANRDGETPMHAAAASGELRIIKILEAHGAKENPRTKSNWTPLHYAVRNGHVNVANYLLEHGAALDWQTSKGKSVFDLARKSRNKRMLSMLESWNKVAVNLF